MKKLVSVLALVAIVASPAFAQTTKKKKKTVVKTTTTTTTTEPATSTPPASSEPAYSTHTSHLAPEYSVDVGLGTLINKFHFGFGFKAQWPVTMDGNDFKFGGQTGFYYGPSTPTTFAIPVLATAEYEFRTSNALKPYVGIGLGIAFAHASGGSATVGGVTVTGDSATSTDFAFLFTPGINCNEGKYFAELPIGVINTSFALVPSVGMHF